MAAAAELSDLATDLLDNGAERNALAGVEVDVTVGDLGQHVRGSLAEPGPWVGDPDREPETGAKDPQHRLGFVFQQFFVFPR